MAERGAHLTSTTQIKPSIFDCLAQESLNDLLHPSILKIVRVLALRNPLFLKIEKWFDEFYFFGCLLLQSYHLRKYGATFSEKFYGLEREGLKISKSGSLGTKEQIWSLLGVILFPYLQSKLNDVAERILLDHGSRTIPNKKKLFIYFHSGLNIFYKGIELIQYLRYLSGKSDIASPLLWAAGVKLKYADETYSATQNLIFKNFTQEVLQKAFGIFVFFIQFHRWWEAEKSSSRFKVEVPPPPLTHSHRHIDNIQRFEKNNKCPICWKKRYMDTVLSTSGYVFCFQCISTFLKNHNYCPVTKLPATIDNLIYIYSPS